MLLEDVFVIENLQVLNEGKTGPMRVRGVFQRADEENNNKRIYPKALLEREIQKLDEAMKGRRLMGELDHPQHDSVKLSNVSHLITKLEAKGNEIIGEAEILDTPMGKVARALIEGGVQIGISSRGMGTLSEGQDGKRYVNEDFRLITWDLVADPSTRGAFPTLAESTNANSMLVEEILNDVLPKVTKQKVFTTLLEEALNERSASPVAGRIAADNLKRKERNMSPEQRKAYRQRMGMPATPKKESTSLFGRVGSVLSEKKLVGRQHVLDKNKNGRLDSQDFKMLRGNKKKEESSTLFSRVGAILSEMESSPEIRKVKHGEAQAKGSKTSKSRRDMSPAYMKSMKKFAKAKPEAARSTEKDLAAARRLGGKK